MVCGQGGLSGLHIGGRTLGRLGMQVHPEGYSVINNFEDLLTQEGTVLVKAVFEGGFNFSASESRKQSSSTALEYREQLRSDC